MSRPVPLGLVEVTARLGLKRQTVDNLRRDGRLPRPDGVVGGRPCWWPETIDAWAAATGRGKTPSSA